ELTNSIYGQFWSKPSLFRNYMISLSVTAFGRDYLVKVSDFAESSVEDYYKEKYGTWGNEDVIDEFIRNTDENILLTCCKKYKNLLLKGVDI
ncbi:33494_t:CDS:2, partial [Gigaspora margarita]